MNRFVGTGVVELFGETTGKFVDEVDLGEFKDQLISVYRQTIATRVPHWSLAQVVRTERLAGVVDSLKKFSYERLAYPLCDENGDISHLTAIVTSCPLEEAKQGFASEAVPWPD
ncbi:MAG: hypothetical protein JJ900_03525 [Rhodospirillales bacterium]|nr:hypothetical protein [Rhodospirillales bacterium]MBO6785896.1 hypothetical protein [Rhodospirillales bacterium]